ncbi:MAG: type II toxin-antitoxin system RelE/ParE family toxin [Patescibacteria group bacterium]
MAFILEIKPKARKNLDKIPEPYRARIRQMLRAIQGDPFAGKALSGNRKGEYSVRVWPYRIIYLIRKQELIVVVVEVDHRGHLRDY